MTLEGTGGQPCQHTVLSTGGTGVHWERTSADAEAQHVPAALQEPLPPLPVVPQLQIQQLPQLLGLLPFAHLGMRWE